MGVEAPRQVVAAGEVIFSEGELGHCAYIVERGRVEITALQKGRRLIIARLEPGELFGEMALLDSEARTATAVALEEVELTVISQDFMHGALGTANPLLKMLVHVLLGRFRWTQRFMLQHASMGAAGEPLEAEAVSRLRLEDDLRLAIAEDQFELHYQPIINLRGGVTAGFEALIRWRHPERGMIRPDLFIGIAEQCGLIVPIGHWVLTEALAALRRLQSAADGAQGAAQPLFMSVNVSGRQLLEFGEIDRLGEVVTQSGVEAALVKLELTESLMVENPDHANVAFQRLKDLGVRIAIDDFGTGYSSLSYLHRFPLDTLKIDRSFVANMFRDQGSMQIVRAIAALAKDLGMDIVAEGIETLPEISQLREFGCDYGQGYLMSKPLPEAEALALLERGRMSW